MKSLLLILFVSTSFNEYVSLPIEPQKTEFRLTSFNPFKLFASDESTHASKEQDPFVSLLRDSLLYLSHASNATLGFIDRTSDGLIAKLKEAKQKVEQRGTIDSEESVVKTSSNELNGPEEAEVEFSHDPIISKDERIQEEQQTNTGNLFSDFLQPWNMLDQVLGGQNNNDETSRTFAAKHNPYDFWADEEEVVVLPQKLVVYPKEEKKQFDDSKLTIKEEPKNKTKKVKCVEVEESDESREGSGESNELEDIQETDPLKATPIELEKFLEANVTIKRNESIKFVDILVSYPPENSTQQFYNLAARRLKEAAPDLNAVRIDGGYVQTLSNETESFVEELQFLQNNLEQIQNSLYANNIKIESFDYVVWWFFEEQSLDQKERAETLATQLQARVYPHIFTKELMECVVELPSDYSNINLTVYIARKTESSLTLAPSSGRTPYYKTLLSALDPFLQFLKSIQKSAGAVSNSMKKWVQFGQPLAQSHLKDNLKKESKKQKEKSDSVFQSFDQPLRRQSNFLKSSLHIEPLLKKD